MRSFVVPKIVAVLLLVTCISVDSASVFAKTKGPGEPNGKSGFPSDWIKVTINNDSTITVPVGAALDIHCEAIGSPPPAVKWYHQETFLFEAGFPEQNEVVDVPIGKLKSRFSISCVLPQHQGVYSCSGSSSTKKKSTQTVTVVVEGKNDLPVTQVVCDKDKPSSPSIVTWSPTLLEFMDRDLELPCSAIGNPAPLVYWLTPLGDVIDSQTRSSNYKLKDNGSLAITRIAWKDMGLYTCVAENALGKEKIETFLYPVKKSD